MVSVEQLIKQASVLRKSAKALLAFTLATAAMSHCAKAQTFAEWFSQKKTQKKYLLQQIAALQIYSGYLQKGYSIAKGGLGSIGGYVGKEFGLHEGYYSYLRAVSIPVSNNPQVKEILRRQEDILQQLQELKELDGLSTSELKYVRSVSSALLQDCDVQLLELQNILADQRSMMSDEERTRQVARLHRNMQDNYHFVARFRSQLQLYARSKQQEMKNANALNQLYANQ